MILIGLALALTPEDQPDRNAFPENMPYLMEACLKNAVDRNDVTTTADSYKYVCTDDSALRLWSFLESVNVSSWEQDVGDEGVWQSRDFPLGGCFKKLRNPDGTAATGGLSCTIWVPRPAAAQ